MKKVRAKYLVFLFLLLIPFQPAAMATLVTDGVEDFETETAYETDWKVTDSLGGVSTDGSGNNYALLVGSNNQTSSLSQTLTLDPSLTTVEFDYAFDSRGISPDTFQITLYNGTDSIVLFQDGVTSSPQGQCLRPGDSTFLTNPGFRHMSIDLSNYDLSAFWGGSATLSFELVDQDSWTNTAFALDNITVNRSAPIPELGTIFLIGGGLLGAGVYRKRKALRKRSS